MASICAPRDHTRSPIEAPDRFPRVPRSRSMSRALERRSAAFRLQNRSSMAFLRLLHASRSPVGAPRAYCGPLPPACLLPHRCEPALARASQCRQAQQRIGSQYFLEMFTCEDTTRNLTGACKLHDATVRFKSSGSEIQIQQGNMRLDLLCYDLT